MITQASFCIPVCVGMCEVSPLGSTFQAMVSVMAVKIQLSSPRGVRLSLSLPGILHQTQDTVSAALTRSHLVDLETWSTAQQLLSNIITTDLTKHGFPCSYALTQRDTGRMSDL